MNCLRIHGGSARGSPSSVGLGIPWAWLRKTRHLMNCQFGGHRRQGPMAESQQACNCQRVSVLGGPAGMEVPAVETA